MSLRVAVCSAVLLLVVLQSVFSADVELNNQENENHIHEVEHATPETEKASHNLKLGKHNKGDELLYRKHVKVARKPGKVVDVKVHYPSHELITDDSRDNKITYIDVTDHVPKGNGGYPKVTAGGIHQKSVTIDLKSKKDHGMEFVVKIYGRNH